MSVVSRDGFSRVGASTRAPRSSPAMPRYQRWTSQRNGLYATNGAVLTVFTRSSGATLPDLFCMGLVARFDGYAPGYSSRLGVERNYLTWVILKAHTKNTAGQVTLQSADPRDTPRGQLPPVRRRRRRGPRGGDRRRALRPRAQRAPPCPAAPGRARSCRAATCSPRQRFATSCATARGGTTPAGRARSAPARPMRRRRQPLPGPRHRAACASSTRRFSREFQGSSSPARST